VSCSCTVANTIIFPIMNYELN